MNCCFYFLRLRLMTETLGSKQYLFSSCPFCRSVRCTSSDWQSKCGSKTHKTHNESS